MKTSNGRDRDERGRAGLDRRDFLKFAAAAAAVSSFNPWPAVAGPFTRNDFEELVPRDKKLSPEWVKSLFEKGNRETYRGADLEKIGMPIGGIGAGQLYLGGDGQLWHWDIFNQRIGTNQAHYANPMKVASPLDQGFALRIAGGGQPDQVRSMDRAGWREVEFTGEYPIGYVHYRDPDCPVKATLEAFSPFLPLNVEDSSLPVTLLQFTVENLGGAAVEGELAGWIENAVCLYSSRNRDGLRRNRAVGGMKFSMIECSAEALPDNPEAVQRPDIVFDDFEHGTYRNWKAEGDSFGNAPAEKSKIPGYQGDLGMQGNRCVNSHATAPGGDVGQKDARTGALTSKSFTIERNYINFLVGGGSHKDRTCINLLVDDKAVLSVTGSNDNRMKPHSWDVRQWMGKTARLRVVDQETGGWGNVSLDHIVFSDRPRAPLGPLADEPDFGTMGLALLGDRKDDRAIVSLPATHIPAGLFSDSLSGSGASTKPFGNKLSGALVRKFRLPAGGAETIAFLVVWHFPNLKLDERAGLVGRHYATRFKSALEVAEHVAANADRLAAQTRLWHDTWYDSTLPWWFLNRTLANASILASSTCHRFANGRFYGWEGVGCCAGTCGHVWQYAQTVGRLFPQLERDTRERVDFGLAQEENGAIRFRGEFNRSPAVDGQAGTILRALREHQVSADATWLKRNWPKIKQATQWLIDQDGNGDGLLEGGQHNTLDADWYGPVAWLSGMYLAALRAAEGMAQELGDEDFARRCRGIYEKGVKNLIGKLFDQEYFINRPDPKRPDTINSGTGCHIDQVLGQSWAFQVGLGRVLPEQEVLSALKSLWRYNFTPDVGPYRDANKPGRWYAMPGEGGLIMCTFPRTDWDYQKAAGKGPGWAAGYFNECMNGFEYQVAGHMIWEGMVMEGLAITRMVHDRYHPSRRNPWNEIECGDHYARSMASHGVFLAACGYEYHGPKGHLGFDPKVHPENFKSAFTAADGWGSFTLKTRAAQTREARLDLQQGQLRLRTLAIGLGGNFKPTKVDATADKPTPASLRMQDGKAFITFTEDLMLKERERPSLAIVLSS